MENINKLTVSELGVTLVKLTEGVTSPRPLTTAEDVAVEIKVKGARKTYDGFVSLSEKLTELDENMKKINLAIFNKEIVESVPEGSEEIPTETAEIDTLQEVYNVLQNYTNTDIINKSSSEIEEVTEELINSLFNEKS